MIALSFDPGSRLSAWALLESRGIAPQPITITLLQCGMIESQPKAVEALLNDGIECAPDAIVIETLVGGGFKATTARGGAQAVFAAVMKTAKVEQMIRDRCEGRGSVVDISAAQWRYSVCGRANAKGPVIARRLRQLVHGLRRSNEHTRDAIGAGVAVIWSKGGRA
jgi:hypothetical protein